MDHANNKIVTYYLTPNNTKYYYDDPPKTIEPVEICYDNKQPFDSNDMRDRLFASLKIFLNYHVYDYFSKGDMPNFTLTGQTINYSVMQQPYNRRKHR